MPEPTGGVDESQGDAHRERTGRAAVPNGGTALIGRIPRLGIWAWSFVGLVVATVIVVAALAAVSEIVLPLTFAAVLAVIFKPLAGVLERHRVKPGLAAGLVVLGLLAAATGAVVATVRGVTAQADQIAPRSTPHSTRQPPHWASTRAPWTRPGRPPRRRPRRSPAAS